MVFLGDKLKQDLFGEEEAVGKTVMIDNVPFLVIGVMQEKAQDSSYSGRDKDKAFMPETTYRGLFSERYVDNFIFQAKDAAKVPEVTRQVYEVLGRRHKFDPNDKEAIGMWDTTEGEKFFRVFFGDLPRLPGHHRLVHADRGRHRRLEHHVRGGGGAHARDRDQAGGGRQARASSRASS